MNSDIETNASNPLELEARADELEAEALRLRARAKRARINFVPSTVATPIEPLHQTRTEYARRSRVSEATVSRWIAEGMPTLPVGSTVRIDPTAADRWRRARGRKPTKATARVHDVDVDDELTRAGLRLIGGTK